MTALLTILGLTLGNFFMEWFQVEPNWATAFKLSFSQAGAIVTYVLLKRI